MPAAEHFFVNGIVAARDNRPYIQLSNEHGIVAQLTMAQTRKVCQDMLTMAARCEADAMIIRFFEQNEFPPGVAGRLMIMFRDFRHELDMEEVAGGIEDPDSAPGSGMPPPPTE